MSKYQQPWTSKPWIDIVFILFPPFGCLLFIALFPALFANTNTLSDYWWVVLVLLVDVAHVYSTLYRTYFDGATFKKHDTLLVCIPFISFIVGVLVYTVSPMFFWSVLAYIAVYHFIRQQYGFMKVYSRKEHISTICKKIDIVTIYAATIYPIVYWHLSTPRNFNWFVQGDFFTFQSSLALKVTSILYYGILIVYFVKEIYCIVKYKQFNIPRIAVIAGTILSWYFGIVYFNGDMAFTLLNVVSHGIPYMALIWIYGKKNYSQSSSNRFLQRIFSNWGIVFFLGLIFLFAFVEEGLWDITVWKEHQNIFGIAPIQLNKQLLTFIVPLLTLPQITHYVIDGFIWRIKDDNFKWNSETAKLNT